MICHELAKKGRQRCGSGAIWFGSMIEGLSIACVEKPEHLSVLPLLVASWNRAKRQLDSALAKETETGGILSGPMACFPA
jgi:hypothetical protein